MLLLAITIYTPQNSLCFAFPVVNLFQYSWLGAAVYMINDSQMRRFCFINLSQWCVMEIDCTAAVDVEHQCLIGTDLEKLLSTEIECRSDLVLE